MRKSGTDSLSSWMYAAACCFINMVMVGLSRVSGLLFVSSIVRFHTTTQRASFPYSCCMFVRYISGPLTSYLGNGFSAKTVTTLGCVVGAVGIATCFLAESIDVVIMLYGVVFGLGFGLSNTILPSTMDEQFCKYKTTAKRFYLVGSTVGSLILTPLVDFLLESYGLSGTFLILSSIILNCIPVSLLLDKPDRGSQEAEIPEEIKRNSTPCDIAVKFYAGDDDSRSSDDNLDILEDDNMNSRSLNIPKIEIDGISSSGSLLSYQEKIRKLSTQTLLSNYLVRMSCSGTLDVEEIIKNDSIKLINKAVLEADELCSSFQTPNPLDEPMMTKKARYHSVQYERPIISKSLQDNRKYSLKSSPSDSGRRFFRRHYDTSDPNFYYQTNTNEFRRGTLLSSSSIPHEGFPRPSDDTSISNNGMLPSISFTKSVDDTEDLPEQNETSSDRYSQSPVHSVSISGRHKICWLLPGNFCKISEKYIKRLIYDPAYILPAIAYITFNFTHVCTMMIIVDFARDLTGERYNEMYVLMIIAVSDLIGHISLNWITEYGYMSVMNFAAVCFATQGIITVAIAWSSRITYLLIMSSLYGVSMAGIMVILPSLITYYIEEDLQGIVTSSNNFLSGPPMLTITPLIGYFRDYLGTYNPMFYGISFLSAVCLLSCILTPHLAKCRRRR